jgi:ligand-binding SRPBCC domain-containing protein
MNFTRFEHASVFPVEVEVLWGFHMRPDSLRLLTPPELDVTIFDTQTHVAEGSVVHATVGRGVLRGPWSQLFTGFDVNRGYTDVALEGPFPFWEHRHEFEVVGRGRAMLRDVIWYSVEGLTRHTIDGRLVSQSLRELFAWRHARTLYLLKRARPARPRRAVHASRALVQPIPPHA